MLTNNLLQIVVEFALVYLFFLLCVGVGKLLLQLKWFNSFPVPLSTYGRVFWYFFAGLFLLISVYSIVVTTGRTVNIFILPLLYYILKGVNNSEQETIKLSPENNRLPWLEVAFVSLLSVVILHLFPESEYKQADSFFYLKIAESLNATGQENISHYNNVYNSAFHGMEPYHYFEMWITAFIIRLTDLFLPSIVVQRFVTYGVLLTGTITGLYWLAENYIKQKLDVAHKIFCWSLLFVLPNILNYFPGLYKLFISDFEGNFLERPNFRIIYLVLIPLVVSFFERNALGKMQTFLMLLLCVISFKCAVVIIPSLFLYGIILMLKKDDAHKVIWLPLFIFCGGFAALYFLFRVDNVSSLYVNDLHNFFGDTVRGYKFILYSVLTSSVYVIGLIILFLLPLLATLKTDVYVQVKLMAKKLQLLLITAAVSLVVARILYLKDNAYQFLFVMHIIVTLFIWLVYLAVLSVEKKKNLFLLSSLFLSMFFVLKPVISNEPRVNTFVQNGSYVYGGTKYSAEYIKDVKAYFKANKRVTGGYMADTNFYKNTYYSRRNPNVYFLPVTYIVANGGITEMLNSVYRIVLP